MPILSHPRGLEKDVSKNFKPTIDIPPPAGKTWSEQTIWPQLVSQKANGCEVDGTPAERPR